MTTPATPEPDHIGDLKGAAERIYASVREAANHLTQDVAGWDWDKDVEALIADAHALAARFEKTFVAKSTADEPAPVAVQPEPVPVTIVEPPKPAAPPAA